MSFLPLFAGLVLSALAGVTEPPPTAPYEPVLEHMRTNPGEQTGAPVILFSTVLKHECTSRCPGQSPWAGELPAEWLTAVRSRGLVADFCTYQQGPCVRPSGEPVVVPGAVYVMFSSGQSCGEECLEVYGHSIVITSASAERQWWTRYRLTRQGAGWSVTSVERVAQGYRDSR